MNTVCDKNSCTGCMACIDICPKDAINIEDSLYAYNAVIQKDKCIGCNACHNVCQVNNPIELKRPIGWKQGWVEDDKKRVASSSGGAAIGIMTAFIKNGGIVYACTFNNGIFGFESANTVEELQKFIGSKYVKSNPRDVYKQIRKKLIEGQKVCQ